MKEIENTSHVEHQGVVRILAYDFYAEKIKPNGERTPVVYVAFEFCSGGTVFDYICSGRGFSEKACRTLFSEVVAAIEILHA